MDVRGRGLSDKDTSPDHYTPLTYAGDMKCLLDALSVEKVILIGTSMGGLMAMIMMNMIPQRILGVILNDIGPVLEQRGLDRISEYVGATEPKETMEDAAEAIATTQAGAFPDATPEFWQNFAKRTYRQREDGRL